MKEFVAEEGFGSFVEEDLALDFKGSQEKVLTGATRKPDRVLSAHDLPFHRARRCVICDLYRLLSLQPKPVFLRVPHCGCLSAMYHSQACSQSLVLMRTGNMCDGAPST